MQGAQDAREGDYAKLPPAGVFGRRWPLFVEMQFGLSMSLCAESELQCH